MTNPQPPQDLNALRFHPEQQTLQEIMERFGLEPIINHFEESGGLRSMRDLVLGSCLKLSPVLSPRLFGLLEEVQMSLGYKQSIDLFVSADASVNAYAIYALDATPHILTLTSSMIERMDDAELRFVLGHEIGHIHFEHYRARLAVQAIGADQLGRSRMPMLLRRRLERWSRLAELSADRAGYAATRGQLEPIVSAFFKISSGLGPEHLKFDIAAFLHQLEELKQLSRREMICGFSHPVTPIRVRALQLFGEACSLAAPDLGAVDERIIDLARLMDYEASEPMEIHGRDLVLAGGLLVAHADEKGFSQDEQELLVEMLLPMTADPEAEIARITSVEQATQLLDESAAWLKQNAGEERYDVYKHLAHIAASDGKLLDQEEKFLLEVATKLNIPDKAAKNMLYEVLAMHLQQQQSQRLSLHRLT